jgi:hypothetical protein
LILSWSYARNYVYMNKIQDLNNLKAGTRDSAVQVTGDTLHHAKHGISIGLKQGHEWCTSGNLN